MTTPESLRAARTIRPRRAAALAVLLTATLALGAGAAPADAIGRRSVPTSGTYITVVSNIADQAHAVLSVGVSRNGGPIEECHTFVQPHQLSNWAYATFQVIPGFHYGLASYTDYDCKFQYYRAGSFGAIDVNHPKWQVYWNRQPQSVK